MQVLLVNDANAGTDITTVPVDLCDLNKCSFHGVFSGSNLVGSFYIEGSNDPTTNFIQITTSVTAITASDDILMPVSNAEYRYIRAVWDWTSGSGNLTLKFVAKENVVKGL